MPYTRPTDLPEFCSADDPLDPERVQQPSPTKKAAGWAYREKPPRNWFNWLHRMYYQWTAWLDQQEVDHEGRIQSLEGATPPTQLPIGSIITFPSLIAPTNFLMCDGTAFDELVYPELFSILGWTNTPNLRDKFIVGAGSVTYPLNATGGLKDVTLNSEELPPHYHYLCKQDDSAALLMAAAPNTGSDLPISHIIPAAPALTMGDYYVRTSWAGGHIPGNTPVAHENRPPYFALAFIIKAK